MVRKKSHHRLSASGIPGIELSTLYMFYVMYYIVCMYAYVVHYIDVYIYDTDMCICVCLDRLILTTKLFFTIVQYPFPSTEPCRYHSLEVY